MRWLYLLLGGGCCFAAADDSGIDYAACVRQHGSAFRYVDSETGDTYDAGGVPDRHAAEAARRILFGTGNAFGSTCYDRTSTYIDPGKPYTPLFAGELGPASSSDLNHFWASHFGADNEAMLPEFFHLLCNPDMLPGTLSPTTFNIKHG